MSDRQADKSGKATWWSVTAFADEMVLLEDTAKYPPFVKKVYGGREKGEESGTEHFQGCVVLNQQQRLAALKSWLPKAHFEPAKHKEALRKYAMKADTATGEKLERVNPVKCFTADEMCLEIGRRIFKPYMARPMDKEPKDWFWTAINCILMENPKMAAQLMNPSLKNFWCETREVWVNLAKQEDDEIRKAITNESDSESDEE